MTGVGYTPGLNQCVPLKDRFAAAADGATSTDIAVAFAKSTGVVRLLKAPGPKSGRVVVGLGFGLTDPPAVEQLEDAGFDVRVVADTEVLSASQFHPKLYLIRRPGELVTLSGSANLTGAGWRTNVEQFEELRFRDPSDDASVQHQRFQDIWASGRDLGDFRRSGDWSLTAGGGGSTPP